MREILFKAKRKNWQELPKERWWVEGYISPCVVVGKWHMFRIEDNLSTTQIETDPETICQYTGLTDENRKKIFEGDYISDGKTIWEVKYCETMSGFSAKAVRERVTSYSAWFSLYHLCNRHNAGRTVQVVGNIFDNSELLKEEQVCEHINVAGADA